MSEAQCGFDSIPGGRSGAELLVTIGSTLLVDIGFDDTWVPRPYVTKPQAGITSVSALIDTGATESCIDDLLATQLALPVFDIRPISGVGGRHEVKMYLAQIYVPSLETNIIGGFAGVHLAAGGQPHRALIGRTFLKNLVMTYDGKTGSVVLKAS